MSKKNKCQHPKDKRIDTSGTYQEYYGAAYQTWHATECGLCGKIF